MPDVLRDLEQRFGLKRIVFIGDRGMVTSQNLDATARSWNDRALAKWPRAASKRPRP